MHNVPSHRLALWAATLVVLFAPGSAMAYIDPNAGGMLFQILAPLFAAIAGAWLFLRRWLAAKARGLWNRLTGKPDA
ncbi:hypothetical protein [Paucibacter soli]|uniref:hypothetical protein n=1 Tax=Paucibacter soli TaxID=3133433 RepID=UPI0030B7C8BE